MCFKDGLSEGHTTCYLSQKYVGNMLIDLLSFCCMLYVVLCHRFSEERIWNMVCGGAVVAAAGGTAVGIGGNSFIQQNLHAVSSQVSVQLNEF